MIDASSDVKLDPRAVLRNAIRNASGNEVAEEILLDALSHLLCPAEERRAEC